MLQRQCCGAAAAILVFTPATATSASPLGGYVSGTYTTIDYPGAAQTDISGINNLGTMVGYYIDTAGIYHGFIYQRGTFTPFNDPYAGTAAGQGTEFYGLNDLGVVVGGYFDTSGLFHSFIYAAGSFVPVNVPGNVTPPSEALVTSGPTDINDAGVIVGMYYNSGGLENGFMLTPGH